MVASSKKDLAKTEKMAKIASTCAALQKKYGKESVNYLGNTKPEQMERFPTGSDILDNITGGGYPVGRIIELFGPASSGKCLTLDTMVQTSSGYKTIEDIFRENGIVPTDETKEIPCVYPLVNMNGKIENTTHFVMNGKREVYRICTKHGARIFSTAPHPLRVWNAETGCSEWKHTQNVRPGDRLVCRKGDRIASHSDGMSADEAGFLGVVLARGIMSDADIGIDAGNIVACDFFLRKARLIKEFAGSVAHSDVRLSDGFSSLRIEDGVGEFYARLGLGSEKERNTVVPSRILNGGVANQVAFLTAFVDYGLMTGGDSIVIPSESYSLLNGVRLMLLNFGIESWLEEGTVGWGLKVYSGDLAAFLEHAGKNFSSSVYAAIMAKASETGNDSLMLDEVVSAELFGFAPTFDFAMSKTHSFVAEGIVNHNTTLCYHAIAEAQKKYKDRFCAFVDSEHSFDPIYAESVGVNVSELITSQPDSGTDAFGMVQGLIEGGAILVVIDSVAAMMPKEENENDDYGHNTIGAQARMMSKGLRKLTAIAGKHKCALLFTNQVRCLPLETMVYAKDGAVPIAAIKPGDEIHNGEKFVRVVNVLDSGKVHGKRLSLERNGYFTISDNHVQPVISNGSLVEKTGSEILSGDWLVSPKFSYCAESKEEDYSALFDRCVKDFSILHGKEREVSEKAKRLSGKLAFFLGCYYSDGRIVNSPEGYPSSVLITENTRERFDVVRMSAESLFGEFAQCEYPDCKIDNRAIAEYVRAIGGEGASSHEGGEPVPKDILKASNETVREFLRGVFIEMTISERQSVPPFCSYVTTEEAAVAIGGLLYSRFGIHSEKRACAHGRWVLVFTGEDFGNFCGKIGFAEESKLLMSSRCLAMKSCDTEGDYVPSKYAVAVIDKYIRSGIGSVHDNTELARMNIVRYSHLDVPRHALLDCLRNLGTDIFNEEIKFLENNRFFRIVSVVGTEFDARDIEVEGGLFVADGILTHNCKIGVMYGNPETTAGGNALLFYTSIRIRVSQKEKVKEKDEDGQEVIKSVVSQVTTAKNKTYAPFKTAQITIRFGEGIDNDAGVMERAVLFGVITRKGAFYSFSANGETVRVKGQVELKKYMDSHPDVYEVIKSATADAMKADKEKKRGQEEPVCPVPLPADESKEKSSTAKSAEPDDFVEDGEI